MKLLISIFRCLLETVVRHTAKLTDKKSGKVDFSEFRCNTNEIIYSGVSRPMQSMQCIGQVIARNHFIHRSDTERPNNKQVMPLFPTVASPKVTLVINGVKSIFFFFILFNPLGREIQVDIHVHIKLDSPSKHTSCLKGLVKRQRLQHELLGPWFNKVIME